MVIQSINSKSNNDYPAQGKTNEKQAQNEPCIYIWGKNHKTKALNSELNEILGDDGVNSYEEALKLAQFCLDLKLEYNNGCRDFKPIDIEAVEKMVKKAHHNFPTPKANHGL